MSETVLRYKEWKWFLTLSGPPHSRWSAWDPLEVAREGWAAGIRRMIVLDLVQVGMHAGTCTEEPCSRILRAMPEMELFAGGGVRNDEDLQCLAALGLRGALVASALHGDRL